jgi:hypothetical protein
LARGQNYTSKQKKDDDFNVEGVMNVQGYLLGYFRTLLIGARLRIAREIDAPEQYRPIRMALLATDLLNQDRGISILGMMAFDTTNICGKIMRGPGCKSMGKPPGHIRIKKFGFRIALKPNA